MAADVAIPPAQRIKVANKVETIDWAAHKGASRALVESRGDIVFYLTTGEDPSDAIGMPLIAADTSAILPLDGEHQIKNFKAICPVGEATLDVTFLK